MLCSVEIEFLAGLQNKIWKCRRQKMRKAICYINQFFAGLGGENTADYKPEIRVGTVGPTAEINRQLKNAEVTHTLICGDNTMGSNPEESVEELLSMLEGLEFDIFFAGPAFQAGRYGNACGIIGKAVKEKFGVEVVSSMNIENPGVEMFKKDMYIFPGGKSAAAARKDIKVMTAFADKILEGETDFLSKEEGFYKRGKRHQTWRDDKVPASKRAMDMLLKKLSGEEYISELPIPKSTRVPIAKPIEDLSKATIAVLNTGGIVPVENPDKIQSASATRWGRYNIEGLERLEGGVYKTIHAGFDPAAADADPNVIVPIDALRHFEKEGKFAKLHEYFYTTVGTGTTEAEASRMAKEIIPCLKEADVNGLIMVST